MRRPNRGNSTMSPERDGLNFDPNDPLQVAVKITRMQEQLARTQEVFTETVAGFKQSMEGLRSDFRDVSAILRDIPKIVQQQDQQQAALDRAFNGLRGLRDDVNRKVERGEEDAKKAWEAQTERLNKINTKLNVWTGVGMGLSLMSSLLIGTLIYIYRTEQSAAIQRTTAIETRLQAQRDSDVRRLDEAQGETRASVREMERYLTQEGTVNGRPYVPTR